MHQARCRDVDAEPAEQRSGSSKQKLSELSKLLARCYFKQGEWQVAFREDWYTVWSSSFRQKCGLTSPQRNVDDILHAYMFATVYDPKWYKAWHTWALANFEVISYLENQNDARTDDIPGNGLAAHIVQAIRG